jgi:hypothetical protein
VTAFLLRLRNAPLTGGRCEVLRLHVPQTWFPRASPPTVSLGEAASKGPLCARGESPPVIATALAYAVPSRRRETGWLDSCRRRVRNPDQRRSRSIKRG